MKKIALEAMIQALGQDKVSQSESDLYGHSHDESSHQAAIPDLVCFPENIEDLQAILKNAKENKMPLIPYGAGSGLEGQVIPTRGGISIDFSNMNRVLAYAKHDLQITVQPGMTRKALNRYINKDGLEFPIDPGADASIGGMAATNASGTTAVMYGSMKDQILSMEILLSDGRVIKTGSHAKKSSSGYHLNDLFIGSEGTLGIIISITLKLHGILEKRLASRATFKTLGQCIDVVEMVLKTGLSIRRMELVDAQSIEKINTYMDTTYPTEHTLFFEIASKREAAAIYQEELEEIIYDADVIHYDLAKDDKDAGLLWQARHEISYAFRHQKGKAVVGTDVCVPITKLKQMVELSHDLLEEHGLEGGTIGHIGDGNFHTLIVYDKDKIEARREAEVLHEKIVREAIKVGGTCTGEHGVGLGKKKFQRLEHGISLEVMQSIKTLFDPENILNPGKIFD